MKTFFILLFVALSIIFPFIILTEPQQMKPSIELRSLSKDSICSGFKTWSILFPISDSLQTKNDVELQSLTDMEQVIFFAKEENIHIENPYFESFLVNPKREIKSCFIFCVDSSVTEEKLRGIIEKAF